MAGDPRFHDAPAVLVAHSDAARQASIARELQHHGFAAEPGVVDDWLVFRPDAVVLDLALARAGALPSADAAPNGPPAVIFVGPPEATVEERVEALAFADDYVAEPFAFAELAARIRAVLRRVRGDDHGRRRLADLVLDERTYEVWRGGRVVELTHLEFRLLRFFMANAGRVLSRRRILAEVWNKPFADSTSVETYVRYLRRKLGEGEATIETVRGVGYVLRTRE